MKCLYKFIVVYVDNNEFNRIVGLIPFEKATATRKIRVLCVYSARRWQRIPLSRNYLKGG